jgi:hypothetical protein
MPDSLRWAGNRSEEEGFGAPRRNPPLPIFSPSSEKGLGDEACDD